MRKSGIFLLLLLLVLVPAMPVQAQFANPSVIDEAGYLYQEEEAALAEKLDAVRRTYNCEVAIYIEEEMSGYDAESTADDIYDYNGYGAGENSDGILLYLCADTREYHFTTHGYGLTAFNQRGLAYLEKQVLSYLEDGDYAAAFHAYAETAEELLEMAAGGEPYNKKQHSPFSLTAIFAGVLLFPFTIARSMTKKQLRKMNTAVKQKGAANYMKPDSRKISISRDIFLYSSVTKTEKAKSDSATHTSSSGRTHGGRGGSY